MKKIIILLVLTIGTLFVFQSCDSDNTPIEERDNLIKYRITSDTPGAQLHVNATGLKGSGLYVKEHFEKELYTKDFFAVIEVECDDPNVAIHVELFVNKKFRISDDGNSRVFISERLKGKGPYLY